MKTPRLKHVKLLAIVLTLAFVCALTAFSQQVPEKDVMTMSVPEGAKKLTEKEYADIQSLKYKQVIIYNSANHLYQRDGAVIAYQNNGVSPISKKSMETQQKMWTSILAKGRNNCVVTGSKIITLTTGVRFLIVNYHDDNAYSIKFLSDYDSQLHFIPGNVNYEKGNDEKAQQFLMELLQSMHFAN